MTHFSEEIFRIWEENEENEEDENISYPKVKLRERLRMDLIGVIRPYYMEINPHNLRIPKTQ